MSDNKDHYKETVFLPKTDFPMRGGLPQNEPKIVARWQEMDLYSCMNERAAGREKWILHDGPPYANGDIHMGHALNKILKDVVVKSWHMMGYDTPYVPGWDCHGLPIEWKIEEKYRNEGKDKDAVDILAFREECRQFAQGWVDIQSEQFQRLGVTGDWGNPYLTMRKHSEGKIVREIHKFAMNEGLYRGAKPIMWSVVEKTALAEAEIEYLEHKSVTIWIRFPVETASHELLKGADIVIWTTTPWTMPSNRAIAFGEAMEYGVYEVKAVNEGATAQIGDRLAVATALSEGVKASAKIEEWKLVGTLKGSEVTGTICQHPFNGQDYDFDVPLLTGDFVTEEAGTGFVHIAPGHGEDDFNLGVANDIEVTDNVSDDGKFRDHVPLFAGMEVYTQEGKLGDGNFAILKAMAEAGKLLAKGSMRHEYPHSWRSKAPLIFRTTPQWFISMATNNLRETALQAIKDTNWVPAKGEARINAMIEGRPDWCISRQRAWGVPIALFLHKETGEVMRDEAVFETIGRIFEEEGADAWWSRDAQDFLAGTDYKAADYDQVFDIVDVWFESGSTHAFVCEDRPELRRPEGKREANLYLEGSDQHRGWFHSSLLESCGTRGRAPYDNVLTHGFVLDDKGYKMSKSQGNVIDPLKMMDQYGADILRLWTMTCDYAEDIRIGKDTLKNTGDLYRRIRNTLRFLLGSMEGFTAEERLDLSDREVVRALPELERLMLHELSVMEQSVRSHIEKYEFGKVAHLLHAFCNQNLSAFYFDIRKDSLYCDAENDFTRQACRSVMAEIFNHLSAWLAPILCFTTEEAWGHIPAGMFEEVNSIHLRDFPTSPDCWADEGLVEKWNMIKKTRKSVLEAIEPLRASKELGSSLEAKAVISTEHVATLKTINMADICITSQIELLEGAEGVEIGKAEGQKCQRCWKVLPEVTEEICTRCTNAVAAHKSKAA